MQTFAAISAGLERLRRLGQELQAAARNTSGQAQSLLDDSLVALQRAELCASKIVLCADEAVFHLQYGDIIRQKSEHILAALQDAAATLSGTRASDPLSGSLGHVESLLGIQASQLEAVRAEALAAHSKLTEAFEKIAAETEQLAHALQPVTHNSLESASGSDPLEAFARDCYQMQALQQQGRALSRRAETAAGKAAAAARQLSTHFAQLGEVNFELHLKALNAIVKTAALGNSGATLEVLSSQIDRLFRESSREVSEIFDTLERLRPLVTDPASATHAVAGSASGGLADEHTLAELMGRIRQAHQEFASAAADADRLVGQQQASLAQSLSQLAFLSDLAEDFVGKATELSHLRQLLAPWTHRCGTSPSMLESLGDRYTMQSEREVHARVSGGLPAAAPIARVSTDDVELFEPAEKPQLEKAEFATGKPSETPSLRQTNEDAAAPPLVVAAANQELGDNVELF